MAVEQLNKVIHNLRHILDQRDWSAPPDCDLLRRYVQLRDEAAFETLVRRHGPMVLGVCRRILRNLHDAEDAFQAYFLVLVRKAPGLRAPGTIGNWLYGVAYRTALHARGLALKRRTKEASVAVRTEVPEDPWSELRDILDRELERLPEKYRTVVVLCDLQGKTRKEAARHLGWAEGTVASRLARSRCLLAKRLSQSGLAVTAAAVAMQFGQNAAPACVPQALLGSTIKAASLFGAGQAAEAGSVSAHVAVLAQGVLKTMLLTKLKSMAVVLALTSLLGAGMVGLIHSTQAALPDNAVHEAEQKAKPGTNMEIEKAEAAVDRAKAQVDAQKANLAVAQAALNQAEADRDRALAYLKESEKLDSSVNALEKARRLDRIGPGPDSVELADQETWKKASVGDKYSMLLKKIEVKADLGSYKEFNDFGEWPGTSYAGNKNLPVGYWVYVYPNWYIWGAKDAPLQEDATKASVGGAYTILLKKLEAKEDRESYSEFNDYGAWQGTSYAGHNDLPVGYWVYVYPNWYIWAAKNAKPAAQQDDVKRASVGGKYSRLLKKIEEKADLENYNKFHDYGAWQGTSYAGHNDLPAGYWVYVYPNWYIWGDTKGTPKEEAKNAWGERK